MTAPTASVSPSLGVCGGIRRTPLSRDSISWVAFSLSRLKIDSPAFTTSPSCLSQPAKIPSSMFQPSRGTVISIAMILKLPLNRNRKKLGNQLVIERPQPGHIRPLAHPPLEILRVKSPHPAEPSRVPFV